MSCGACYGQKAREKYSPKDNKRYQNDVCSERSRIQSVHYDYVKYIDIRKHCVQVMTEIWVILSSGTHLSDLPLARDISDGIINNYERD